MAVDRISLDGRQSAIVEFKVLKYLPANLSRVPHINKRRVLEIAVVVANQTVAAGVGAYAVGGAEILPAYDAQQCCSRCCAASQRF